MPAENIVILIACLSSCSWHMMAAGTCFVRPTGLTPRMLLVLASFAVCLIVQVRVMWSASISATACVAAMLVYVAAAWLFHSARAANRVRLLSAAYSRDVPQHLVGHGPYRFIRHPFYAAYCLTWLAGAIACWSLPLLVTFAWMLGVYVHAARFEERKFALSSLAEAYSAYRERTGMLIPGWGRTCLRLIGNRLSQASYANRDKGKSASCNSTRVCY